ncbi:MAG: hypothetical protein JNK41_14570 [Saprospiraceae bacterium]|jgi:hypothetical protein|nr:hypothetical protein [Saprospiraceae bacterium]
MKAFLYLTFVFACPLFLNGQELLLQPNPLLSKLEKFSLSGYGAMNYYNFDWQTDTAKRNSIDNERFILAIGYKWNPKIRLGTEIEFEHGGTGVDVEFDRFEEFGEFEYEVSKGGEVLLEQMFIDFAISKNTNLQVGRIKVPFSMMFSRDEPTDYLTALNSEMETNILPENWTENGLMLIGTFGKNNSLKYHLGIVNGLDGSAFNSANWIKRGNQRRFEMVNADNFAFCGRIDFKPNDAFLIGLSLYGGNTTNNRPKPDLKVSTPLGLGEVHISFKKNVFNLNGMLMYGALGNSEALTNQNRNLSNNLNVKRTPVGSAAIGSFLEAGATVYGKDGIFKNINSNDYIIFGRFDYYDTMFATEGLVFNNPRWKRETYTLGLVVKIINDVHVKAQYSVRKVGAPAPTSINGGTLEKSFICGFAFEF